MIVISRCQSMSKRDRVEVPSSGLGMRAVSVMGDQRHLHDATSCRPYGQLLTDSGGQSTPAAWPASWIRSGWNHVEPTHRCHERDRRSDCPHILLDDRRRESRLRATSSLTRAGRSLCQSSFSPPNFCVVLPRTAKAAARALSGGDAAEGDVLATNDPWIGTGHLPDYVMISPVFRENQVVAFIGSIAHVSDVGGHAGDIEAMDVFQEGVRLPPCKLYVLRASRTRTCSTMIEANCRVPDLVLGDLRAMIGTHRLGAARLAEFLDDYGLD